ncbi:MAG: 4-hydroxybenzoate octaprenyltransferase [Alphaproteobacteria bacterium]|jgi:4-hydroxybenzoate polyprenyltransferase|nr:4-hydroxybenzoate octaprenyltransferase [Alphaproteobacteria bacterium]MBT4085720.1 4-hydroxybenzoate octaprenyltransferase [Alphaproteobacteria bacterium]MBT4543299.1 4-hydroxybenzoate octaprenyltransferase [Alphaproteobacteria bacterium]MBT7747212.1 4-hydroxybenzoate octaprenyltransferase [Alphaproteobacteria bacterium]
MPKHPQPTDQNVIADAGADNWVDRQAPDWFKPYLKLGRFDRPIGSWLLLWPCWWSLALVASETSVFRWPTAPAPGWPDPLLIALFFVGAFVMRGAGCTLNDIADRNFDGKVERTAKRPIPSGQVSVLQAAIWMGLLCLIGLGVLLTFNNFAIATGVASLLIVVIYPFMKRFTYWPQFGLGLAFNWGALLGWAAVTGTLSPAAFALYAAGIAWTLGYDTIYAHQDKDDDIMIGVKSTALRFGAKTKNWLVVFYLIALGGIAAAGWIAQLSWAFYVGLIFAAAHLAWQIITLDIDDWADCLTKFKSNHYLGLGLIVFLSIVAGQVI